MGSKFNETDLGRIRPISIHDRESKVHVDQFVDPDEVPLLPVEDLRAIFPDVLQGDAIKRVADAILAARAAGKEIVWLVGAHVIKCGLSLYLNRLMQDGFVTALATTGSATVHDIELAFYGKTSEDVGVELPAGRFGMVAETADHFALACARAADAGAGLGESIGAMIESDRAPHARVSVFAGAHRAGIPATVHVALGTDITHQHPGFPAAKAAEASMRDFRIHTDVVGRLFDSGVVIIFGSAVVLPEVFLKAVSINYNLGKSPSKVTAVSFDMLQQYRVRENVLSRPFQGASDSYAFAGHHELMLPLLFQLLQGGQ